MINLDTCWTPPLVDFFTDQYFSLTFQSFEIDQDLSSWVCSAFQVFSLIFDSPILEDDLGFLLRKMTLQWQIQAMNGSALQSYGSTSYYSGYSWLHWTVLKIVPFIWSSFASSIYQASGVATSLKALKALDNELFVSSLCLAESW